MDCPVPDQSSGPCDHLVSHRLAPLAGTSGLRSPDSWPACPSSQRGWSRAAAIPELRGRRPQETGDREGRAVDPCTVLYEYAMYCTSMQPAHATVTGGTVAFPTSRMHGQAMLVECSKSRQAFEFAFDSLLCGMRLIGRSSQWLDGRDGGSRREVYDRHSVARPLTIDTRQTVGRPRIGCVSAGRATSRRRCIETEARTGTGRARPIGDGAILTARPGPCGSGPAEIPGVRSRFQTAAATPIRASMRSGMWVCCFRPARLACCPEPTAASCM